MPFIFSTLANKLGLEALKDYLTKNRIKYEKDIELEQKIKESLFLPTIEALGQYKNQKINQLIDSGNLTLEQASLITTAEVQGIKNKLKQQDNIEKSFIKSIEIIEKIQNENNKNEKIELSIPDEDWLREWANNAGKFSKESAQKLWGAVLAGKMQNNDSFSFQTMDIMRKMSDSDAKLFIEFCSIQINHSVITESEIWQDYLSWSDIFHLSDLNLIDSNSITTHVNFNSEEFPIFNDEKFHVPNLKSPRYTSYIATSNTLNFIYQADVENIFQQKNCFRLTKSGQELLQLASKAGDDIKTNIDYLIKLGIAMRKQVGTEKCAFIITNQENEIIVKEGLEINLQTKQCFITPKNK